MIQTQETSRSWARVESRKANSPELHDFPGLLRKEVGVRQLLREPACGFEGQRNSKEKSMLMLKDKTQQIF